MKEHYEAPVMEEILLHTEQCILDGSGEGGKPIPGFWD